MKARYCTQSRVDRLPQRTGVRPLAPANHDQQAFRWKVIQSSRLITEGVQRR